MRHCLPYFPTIAWLALTGASLAQSPVIRANGVVNGASHISPGLPNYGIAQGSVFLVKGQGLYSRMPPAAAASNPLPLTLSGASMQIAITGAKIDVPMVSAAMSLIGDDLLAGILPSSTPTGDGTVTVTFNGRTSAAAPITIVPRAFGIFTLNQSGVGPGVFTSPDLAVNSAMAQRLLGPFFPDTNFGGASLVAAAHPGDPLVIWGTGLGADLDAPVEVYAGNIKADVASVARASCCMGVDQIQFTVPPGVQGCYVPVAVKIGAFVSNFATVSISPDGSVCSDPAGWSASDLQSSPNGAPASVAGISLSRGKFSLTVPLLGTLQATLDFGNGRFKRYSGPPLGVLASIRGSVAGINNTELPSVGCLVHPFQSRGIFFDNLFPGPDDLPGGDRDTPSQFLDAGSALNITGPAGARQLIKNNSNQNSADQYITPDGVLGGGAPPVIPPTPEYLTPGSYTVDNGSGGADVKAFSATFTIPSAPASWTGQDAIGNIPRSQDLTITWGGSGLVAIFGNSVNPAAGVGTQFICFADDASNGTFTVPAWVISALPVSGLATDVPAPLAFLGVVTTLPAPTRFQAPGLDIGYFNWGLLQIKNVNFQ